MKFFSLFKSPKYQTFEFQPRYYDPAKEELKRRVERAKREASGVPATSRDYSSIREAFTRKKSRDRSSSLLQMTIFILLTGTIGGWLFYGNDVFYFYILGVPVYLYFRFKKRR